MKYPEVYLGDFLLRMLLWGVFRVIVNPDYPPLCGVNTLLGVSLNHVYSTWEADVTGASAVQMGFNVPAGKTLTSPSIVINNYTRNIPPAVITLNGTIISGHPSINPVTHQLWLTLRDNLTGNNFLTISH